MACAEHVRRGVAGGFIQVNHGKAPPLRRLRPGDRVVFYSPSETLGHSDGLRSFTALGIVGDGPIAQGEMSGRCEGFRRPVRFLDTNPASVRPLLTRPGFALSRSAWGAKLRFGLLTIDAASMDMIAESMGAA